MGASRSQCRVGLGVSRAAALRGRDNAIARRQYAIPMSSSSLAERVKGYISELTIGQWFGLLMMGVLFVLWQLDYISATIVIVFCLGLTAGSYLTHLFYLDENDRV